MRNKGSRVRKNYLIVFAYAFDPDDMVFSHQYRAILELAKHFKKVIVIANSAKENARLPDNLHVFNIQWREHSVFHNIIRVYFYFISALISLKKLSSIVVFSFMTETHASLVGPITKAFNIRHILWYAHTSTPFRLSLARRLVDRILTSTQSSIKFTDKKTLAIGQMVDERLFPKKNGRDYCKSDKWVHVGRVDPSKNIEMIIEAFLNYRSTHPRAQLVLIGQSTIAFQNYENKIKGKYQHHSENGYLIFAGKRSQSEISLALADSDLFIHAFPGSLDKTLVEATFSGIPIVTANSGFLSEFGSYCREWRKFADVQTLFAKELESWIHSSAVDRERLVESRARIARERHSFEHWLSNLLEQIMS